MDGGLSSHGKKQKEKSVHERGRRRERNFSEKNNERDKDLDH